MVRFRIRLSVLVAGLFLALTGAVSASDRHEGYYYPPVTSEEVFERVIRDVPPAGREVRADFVTMLTLAQLSAPANPRFVFFAKGDRSEKLMVVALDDDIFRTLFRARAVLAQMTSNVRGGDFFRDQDLQFIGTFYDMLQMLGFETLIISDGENWSHKVVFSQE